MRLNYELCGEVLSVFPSGAHNVRPVLPQGRGAVADREALPGAGPGPDQPAARSQAGQTVARVSGHPGRNEGRGLRQQHRQKEVRSVGGAKRGLRLLDFGLQVMMGDI